MRLFPDVFTKAAAIFLNVLALSCPVSIVTHGNISSDCTGNTNSMCTIICNRGFRHLGKTHRIYCLPTGNWTTRLDAICVKDEPLCLSEIQNGEIPSDCQRKEGDICAYRCRGQFSRNPSYPALTCLSNGKWNYEEDELCIKNTCDPKFPNGMVDQTCDTSINSTCNFTCHVGYTRGEDISEVTCLASGDWDRSVTSLCKVAAEVKCPVTKLPKGQFSKDCSGDKEEICGYSCDTGYHINPYVTSVACFSTGNWSHDLSSLCVKDIVTCNERTPSVILDRKCSTQEEDTCNFKCGVGYLQNSSNVTCSSSGKWDPAMDTLCKAVTCETTLPNGRLSEGCRGAHGEHCSYDCIKGYSKAVDDLYVVCLSTGKWSSNLASLCRQDKLCKKTIENGKLSSNCDLKVGSACGYDCSEGYNPEIDLIVCLSSLDWSIPTSQACQRAAVVQLPKAEAKPSSVGIYVGLSSVLVVLVLVCIVTVTYLVMRKKFPKLVTKRGKSKGKYVNSPNVSFRTNTETGAPPIHGSVTVVPDFTPQSQDDIETSFDNIASGYQTDSNENTETLGTPEYETTAEIHAYAIYDNASGTNNHREKANTACNPLYDNATPSNNVMSSENSTEEIANPRDVHIDTSPETGTFEYTQF